MAARQFEGLPRFSVKGPGLDVGRVGGHVRLSERVMPAGPVMGRLAQGWDQTIRYASIDAIAKTLDPRVPSR